MKTIAYSNTAFLETLDHKKQAIKPSPHKNMNQVKRQKYKNKYDEYLAVHGNRPEGPSFGANIGPL
jgi:hypothetical protein